MQRTKEELAEARQQLSELSEAKHRATVVDLEHQLEVAKVLCREQCEELDELRRENAELRDSLAATNPVNSSFALEDALQSEREEAEVRAEVYGTS